MLANANAAIINIIPIRTLSALTGVRSVTLRAWERRYGLLKPARTKKGHRLYSQQDVGLIKKILIYLEQGIAISQVKSLLIQGTTLHTQQTIVWSEYQNKMFAAIKQYSTRLLDQYYNELLSLYPIDVINNKLITYLLNQLEISRKVSESKTTHRSFFLFYLRNKLAADLQHQQRLVNGPTLLVTCLQESKAEINMLLFCLAATEQQYQVIILGTDVPLLELPETINEIDAAGLVFINERTSENLFRNLRIIAKRISIPIFIEEQIKTNSHSGLVNMKIFLLPENRKLAWKKIANKIVKEKK